MHTLYNLFGAPEDVAFDHTYTRKPYLLLLSWLRCAEAMLRRLLLIEASAYPKPNTRPLLRPKRQRVRKLRHFTHDKPEEWRVSFRCFQALRFSSPVNGGSVIGKANDEGGANAQSPAAFALHRPLNQASPDRSPARGGARRLFSAWPLAERYEALLRVYNNPEPYARRLAARLHAVPHRIKEIFRAPPEAEHRIDCYEALTHSAEAAWPQACKLKLKASLSAALSSSRCE
jgi:hypothetical protein